MQWGKKDPKDEGERGTGTGTDNHKKPKMWWGVVEWRWAWAGCGLGGGTARWGPRGPKKTRVKGQAEKTSESTAKRKMITVGARSRN